MTQTTPTNIIVWDWPTRLFHWLLVATFGIAFATSGDDPLLRVHLWSGFLFFGLIVFRIVWGFIGTRYARFSDFVASPAHVIAHIIGVLHRRPQRFLGHNPAGGWAILLLLGLGFLLALFGFLVLGGQEGYGLFAGLLTFAQGHQAMEIHEAICFSMLALIGIHWAGVIVESFLHRENLVAAMFHGRKRVENVAPSPNSVPTHAKLAIVIALGALVTPTVFLLSMDSKPLWANNPGLKITHTWEVACGECHLPFSPSLLPSRSWEALLAGEEDHFGDILALKPETKEALRQSFTGHSAEDEPTEAAYQINHSVQKNQTPQRISDTPYWRKKHRNIDVETWKNKDMGKARCDGCHADAKEGIFDDRAITWHAPFNAQSKQSPENGR
ncbi:MAG: cytochrome b/b6 domain-containing protein [Magnetococcales bacterium]|nr:cytochrome b/b6 domain-containing protein [Magnetococcales bacterium]